jgi:cellulose synthase operon protein C
LGLFCSNTADSGSFCLILAAFSFTLGLRFVSHMQRPPQEEQKHLESPKPSLLDRWHLSSLLVVPHFILSARQTVSRKVIKHPPAIFWQSLLFCLILSIGGCSRDPNVRKQKYLESGERFFAKADYKSADIQFRNALQIDPKFVEAHYQLARTYAKAQDWNDTYRELATTVDLQPQNYQARLDLANLLIAAGELKQAQEQVDVLASKQPQNPDAHLAAADLLAGKQQFSDAIQELKQAISLDPERGETYTRLALLELKTNQQAAAEDSFKKAIEHSPGNVGPQIALGGYYQSQQRFPEAEQQFLHAMRSDQENPDPCIALARLYMAEGKKADAADFLGKSKTKFRANSVGYRMLGDFYFAVADYDNAVKEYGELNRDHPNDGVVTKNYVQLLIIKNRLEEARKLNDAALKNKPRDVDALIERGQIQIAEGRPADAAATLQTAIKNDPNSGPAYYQLGIAYDRGKHPQEAEKAWQDAARRRPDLVEAQRALALVALRKGDMTGLETYASQIVRLQATSPEGYALRALSHIRRLQLSQAEPDVKEAIEVAPQNPAGYLQLGNLMLARKNYRPAEQAYEEALQRESASSDALSGLMNAYFAEHQPESAFSAARVQIAKVPDSSVLYDLLGTAQFDHKRTKQDLEDSEANLNQSIRLDEHNIDAWLKLVQVQAVRHNAEQALTTCKEALQKNPEEPGFYVLLGELYDSKQSWDDAKHAFQKALSLNPQNPAASNDLAYVMLRTGGNPDLAMPLAETARRGMPDSPQAADTMGWVLYEKGAYSSAIDQFQDALKLAQKAKSPDDPTVHYHLGMAYEKTGQVTLAREHLQRVLKINPSYSAADDVKKLLSELRG